MKKFPLKRKSLYLTFAVMLLTFSMPRVTFSQASTSTIQEFVPFSFTVVVPCANGGAGEEVLISGVTHILDHVTTDENRFVQKFLSQQQRATALGLTTGDIYHGTNIGQFTHSTELSNVVNHFAIIFIANVALNGPGPDNNFHLRLNRHLIFNANGEITSVVDNFTVDCN
jgi:hypothetical protein